MRGGLEAVHSLLLVTFETHPGLLDMRTDGIGAGVNAVAAGAGGIVAFVRAADPGERDIALVTGHAGFVLLGWRCSGGLAEVHDELVRGPGDTSPGMLATGTMAGFALQMGHWRLRIGPLPVGRSEDEQHAFVVVTDQTGVRPPDAENLVGYRLIACRFLGRCVGGGHR